MKNLYTFVAAALLSISAFAQTELTTKQTFDYTGSVQTFVIPANVYSIDVDLMGAQGGSVSNMSVEPHNASGGLGGRVQATIAVMPGDVLTIYVGGVGMSDGLTLAKQKSLGGFNGGGWGQGGFNTYNYNAGGGGGATDIRLNGKSINDRIFVAGGGGGASCEGCIGGGLSGGNGGGLIAQDGPNMQCYVNSQNGKGGTQNAGGLPGKWANGEITHATEGTLGQGGHGNDSDLYSGGVTNGNGGGGGGGYYGGGGGNDGPGGGGSSYATSKATNVIHTQGYQKGDGQVVISYNHKMLVKVIPVDTVHNVVVKDTTHNVIVKDTTHLVNNVKTDTTHNNVVINHTIGEEGSINIYPNPFVDNFSVYVNLSNLKGDITVTDMFGQKIYKVALTSVKTDINLANYPSGAYFVKIQIPGGISVMKKVIKK